MVVILDTDVMVDILRGHSPALSWLTDLGNEVLGLPGFVVMELIQGCRSKREQELLERTLLAYKVLWPQEQDYDAALAIFAAFHLSSGIGVIDTIIAQTAIGLGKPLYTFNEKHYSAIHGLKTIRPYNR